MLNKIKQIITLIQYHPGMSLSVLMHLALFSFILVSFPQCQKKASPEIIISLDLLPIAQKTNIENKQASTPEVKKESEKPIDKPKFIEKEQEAPREDPKPEEAIPVKEIKPDVKKPEEKKNEKLKQDVKKPEKEKKKKPKISESDAVLKNLEDLIKKNDKKEKIEKTTRGPTEVGAPMALSVKDSIKRQIENCWNPPAGNKDAGKLQILLNIAFNRDGSVANVKIVDSIKYGNDELYKVAADAAVRAVYKSSPLQDLPAGQYDTWKNLELNFDPSNLIY